ncbi:hypothetical protein [Sphingopyxis bauzanensis]|uniref:hypothetical protein n=1 Tax=Sphingopyxis bauzanensis TaxID=651663 RepID=UPI0011817A0B|nr:hypothetical protein [Sphingopyxis bauzanensis]
MRALDQRAVRPETMNRVSHMFVEALGQMYHTRLPRTFLKGATPFIGTQWKVVSAASASSRCITPAPRVSRPSIVVVSSLTRPFSRP